MKERFDLSTLTGNTKAAADEAAATIRARMNCDVREIGRQLMGVKAVLPHGAFLPWLAAEVQITPRTAQNYMNAALFLQGKSETVSHLPPALIYRLASSETPAEVVARLVDTAARGERLDVRATRDSLAEAAFQRREERRERREEQRKEARKVSARRRRVAL